MGWDDDGTDLSPPGLRRFEVFYPGFEVTITSLTIEMVIGLYTLVGTTHSLVT